MAAAYKLDKVFLTQEEIERRADEIGKEISRDYAGKEVTLIGILTGSVMWMAQVMKSIEVDTSIDFLSVSSYGAGTKSSGVVKIYKDLNRSATGKHVIIVEDIVDSGVTLDYLLNYLSGQNPASIKVCSMLDKPTGRRMKLEADYVGFEVPGVFLVGYGLDVDQRFRNLPYIASVAVE
ncbi:MAG: hypoxanthine phosphoribosyltransferase [Clostridiales Family XIII bacterium]|jgi:hypoxanthine phosphoribosyltransferase|nr:hypoxanthine phosphoribosyltransferase [Clostridiales Family XIII bacterium]